MEQQSVSEQAPERPAPPASKWVVKILLWAVAGAAVGVFRAQSHYETEGWLGPVAVFTVAFAALGAAVSLVASRCRT
jgi:hypothetical protein